ncbi:unnamed protein product [Brassicogethes aeneus]|uniref:UDP-glucuronosyltransferase n=1 Tax=Brassicogethes aeneus TaxID=1431903 RepID=A0A9P0FL86_BRAAE|nr:unnamed protein product [Brassicogethes aeneus]
MNVLLVGFIFIVEILSVFQCANILFFAGAPSKSHQVMFQPVFKELSLRGHNVTAIVCSPLKDPKLTNLTEIDLGGLYEIVYKEGNEVREAMKKYIQLKPDLLTVFSKDMVLKNIYHQFGKYILDMPQMQTFLKEDHKFDVVIVEWLYPTFAALAAKYDAPLIGITSLGAPILALDTVGNPSHPVLAPDQDLPMPRDLTFKERLMSGLYAVYVRVYYHLVVLPREDALARKHFGKDIPYLGDIEKNISLLLLNRNLVFHKVMPVVPAIIELGYMNTNKSVGKMDPELQDFMDKSRNGVVYFSLGSNVQVLELPKDKLNAILNTFKNIKYDVVFKINKDTLDNKPKNVLTRKWVPQGAILKHKNTKLFITQGGLQSCDETIINQVPVIAIPFIFDQITNADRLAKYGMGKYLDYEDITEEILTEYINEVITKPSYKKNAIILSKLYTDQPTDALEKAIWWIEYVIRHKGASHLRYPSSDLPLYQYLMLDVLFLVFLALSILIFILIIIVKLCICLSRKMFETKTKKE